MVFTKTHLFFLLSASWCAPTNYSDVEPAVDSYEYYEYEHDTNPAAEKDESSEEQVASDYDDYEYRWELVQHIAVQYFFGVF